MAEDVRPSGVDLEVSAGIARLRLANPGHRNALSQQMMDDLEAAYARIATDVDVRAVVVSGVGDDFCAGADIGLLAGLEGIADARTYIEGWRRVYEGLERLPRPTICSVRGYALGAGVELCLAADLVIAADSARFAVPEVKLGAVPGYAMIRLAEAVGRARAMDLMYTGRRLAADEAERWGLITRVVPEADLDAATDALAAELAAGAPFALGTIKRTVARDDSEGGWDAFVAGASAVLSTRDAKRGSQAFLAKEKPTFQGD